MTHCQLLGHIEPGPLMLIAVTHAGSFDAIAAKFNCRFLPASACICLTRHPERNLQPRNAVYVCPTLSITHHSGAAASHERSVTRDPGSTYRTQLPVSLGGRVADEHAIRHRLSEQNRQRLSLPIRRVVIGERTSHNDLSYT